MMGHGGLSKCYMKLKKMDLALEHLNKYYSLSKGANNYQKQADAAFHLAQLYQKQGNQAEALVNYKNYFDHAKAKGGQS